MANNKDYSKLNKEELLKIIEKLESRKKYGLVWDEERTKEHFEKESENALPVLKEVKNKEILTSPDQPINILIEGDNYHALSVLNYTHQGKIDVIYIDPPYNTGSNTWKYNNKYVDAEDAYRHSKWLSFMDKRLRLSKNLLKEDGVMIVTIDDYEVFNLGLLLDEIFGEQNRIGILVMEVNPRGRTTNKFFATCHEYVLFYAKNADLTSIHNLPLTEEQKAAFNLEDAISRYRLLPFRRSGGLSTPAERPNSYYPIYFNEKTNYIGLEKKAGCVEIYPVDSAGIKRVWRQTRPSFIEAVKRGDIVIKRGKNSFTVFMKDRIKEGRKPKTIWIDPRYDASSHGTVLLQKVLGKRKTFDYPKSLYAVIDPISVVLGQKKNAVILDFFAGSGTTGHAVLELNKKNQSSHQFILCTNNENGICEEVCYPRLKKAMQGYAQKNGNRIKGLGGNLKYLKTSFVKKSINKDELKIKITHECTEMLCLREGIFNLKKKTDDYRIFEQNGRIMAVYYSLDGGALKSLKKELDGMKGEKILYCFTLDPLGLDKNDFADWGGVSLEPIPQKILDVYEEIYEY
ncbi:MAG TPA: site-specific DNA-methyltransferase [Candidatus Paceibacterota bacterium]|nr:site-specific DNA-methyltransferase [Candidatus Paceibacterota bacterium]